MKTFYFMTFEDILPIEEFNLLKLLCFVLATLSEGVKKKLLK